MSRKPLEPEVARGEAAAREVLAHYGLRHGAEVELELLVWQKKVLVRRAPLEGSDARLVRVGPQAIMTVDSTITYAPRVRFTIAHEFGHFLLHGAQQNQIGLCLEPGGHALYDKGVEKEANAFAAELMMPCALWSQHAAVTEPDLFQVQSLADRYLVSLPAGAIRFTELSPLCCAVVYCEAGQVSWSAASSLYGTKPQSGIPVAASSIVSRYFRGEPIPSRPESISSHSWLRHAPSSEEQTLIEHCVPIPESNAALSFLWLPLRAA